MVIVEVRPFPEVLYAHSLIVFVLAHDWKGALS